VVFARKNTEHHEKPHAVAAFWDTFLAVEKRAGVSKRTTDAAGNKTQN
jgi:hypothetical protein